MHYNEPREEVEAPEPAPRRGWAEEVPHPIGSVYIETGRGQTAEVPSGSPFRETIERIAEQAHYGGYFRVFLNSEEILNPEEAPGTIEPGMRVAITSYLNRGCVPTNSGKAEMLILSQAGV